MLDKDINKLQYAEHISDELWKKCKGLAVMQDKAIAEWIAEAMQEKFNREYKDIQPEVRHEKGT